jgi:molecular chaperone DnaK
MVDSCPIGIDLGTTFTVVARLDDQGRPQSIPNADGDLTTPSVVLFDDDSVVVGKEAVKAATLEPDRIAQFVKREMGQPVFSKRINGEELPPEVIQSLILEKVKQDAETKVGPIKEVVITVPAYFNEPRRKATQDAGRLAGLEVLDIINEPTAAAIAYGVQQGFLTKGGESKQAETLVVYDLGGGTFDATLMQVDGKNYKVLATDGDVKLGGVDWDRCIVDYLAQQFAEKHEVDPRDDASGFQRLLREAEDAKRSLSSRDKVTITFEHAGQGMRVLLTRSKFESMTAHLLERTRFTITSLLQQANVDWKQVTRLLLVGGLTRMPMVSEMLERESGKKADRTLATDEAVAHGAAIYAGLLQKVASLPHEDVTVTNVNSHNLGILGVETKTGRPRNRVMIPKNTSLPTKGRAEFKTARQGQKNVAINVIEGGDVSGNNSTPIGKFVIQDIPPALPAGTPVQVTFQYAANGRLSVHAHIPKIDRQARLLIEREAGLSDRMMDEWGRRLRNGLKPLNLDT